MPTTEAVESLSFWAGPRGEQEGAWLEHYLASHAEPWRVPLVDALRPYEPLGRVLEVGCHCGPNLKRLRQELGHFAYVGLDVNGAALGYGRHVAHRDGYGDDTHWFLASIVDDRMGQWPSRSADVVFCSSCLSVVEPEELPMALGHMCRIADRVVAIHEPAETRHNGTFHQWGHDYLAVLKTVPGADAFVWAAQGDVVVGERLA